MYYRVAFWAGTKKAVAFSAEVQLRMTMDWLMREYGCLEFYVSHEGPMNELAADYAMAYKNGHRYHDIRVIFPGAAEEDREAVAQMGGLSERSTDFSYGTWMADHCDLFVYFGGDRGALEYAEAKGIKVFDVEHYNPYSEEARRRLPFSATSFFDYDARQKGKLR